MPRPLRIQYAEARYHVMSQGDRRERIFYYDADCQEFLKTLGQACLRTGWQVHAYCLMGNHFQWIAERLKMGGPSYISKLLGSVDSKL